MYSARNYYLSKEICRLKYCIVDKYVLSTYQISVWNSFFVDAESPSKKNIIFSLALAGVAQCIEHRPENQPVAGSIPSQGTCLGCRPGPQCGA